jgi:hypothetical protein
VDEQNLKTWELLWAQIAQEEGWARQRVMWLLGTTALLIAAFGAFWAIRIDVSIRQTIFRGLLLLLLPAFGFVLTLLTLIGLVGSSLAIRAVDREWKKLVASADERADGRRRLPALRLPGAARALAQVWSWGTCVIVMLTWVAIVVLTVHQI